LCGKEDRTFHKNVKSAAPNVSSLMIFPVHSTHPNPAGDYFSLAAGFFDSLEESDLESDLKSDFEDFSDYLAVAERKLMFNSLIKQRIDYLDKLPTLRNDWISNDSAAPSTEVCKIASSFLRDFEKFVLAEKPRSDDTKLVLGPIPTGGVGIELSRNGHGLFVSLHNDKRVEIDTEVDSHFSEEETTLTQFEEDFIPYFRKFAA